MELKEVVLKRRSVRKYKDTPISDDMIQELLVSAMSAPSACNKQPWEYYVVKNKEKLQELYKANPYANYGAPLIIIVCGDMTRRLTKYVDDFWIQDCSAAIENILLTATDLGLGSCWCGISPMEVPIKRVSRILELPENIVPLGLVQIGYADMETEARSQYDEKYVHIID